MKIDATHVLEKICLFNFTISNLTGIGFRNMDDTMAKFTQFNPTNNKANFPKFIFLTDVDSCVVNIHAPDL